MYDIISGKSSNGKLERLNSLVSAEQDNPDLLSVPSTSASTSANTANATSDQTDHTASTG